MVSTASRVASWVGFIGDLLQEPLSEMPHDRIFDQLETTFGVAAVSYDWTKPDGLNGVLIRPAEALRALRADPEVWAAGERGHGHPLITWHLTTGDPRPSTNDRVPTTMVPIRQRQPIMQFLRPIGLDQQLSINFRLTRSGYRAYVLGRSGTDFSDDDLSVAQQIQTAIVGLDRQTSLVRRMFQRSRTLCVDAGLTGREFAVLGLLDAGHSTQLIARRLGCSSRTVHKHLERIYRKLGVRDRVNALRIARLWGII